MKALKIVVISGQVGSGKTTLALGLAEKYGAELISTKELLRLTAERRGDDLAPERGAMQRYGTMLDEDTGGQWVADAAGLRISVPPLDPSKDGNDVPSGLFIIDAVRIAEQIDKLRTAFAANLVHVHLHSSTEVLSQRYAQRGQASGLKELSSYGEVAQDPTEQKVADLKDDADVSIDTERSNKADVLIRAAAALRLLPDADTRLVDILIGAQYGSEGKGNVAFFLAKEYDLLVRVGGPNAGHKVPLPEHYVHRQLPSGTQANPDAKLLIGPGATVDPNVLLNEISDCGVEVGRLFIDPQVMIIEPEDLVAEQGLVEKIGSCDTSVGSWSRLNGRTPFSL